jgi:hypothetical protein
MDYSVTRMKPWYPGQLGVPGSDNELGLKHTTQGTVLYVDSTHPLANNANDGTDPEAPLATWAGAVAKTTANHGDVIVLAPRHRETWASLLGSAVLSVAGVTTIGQGRGLDRPRITLTNAASTLTISGASNVVRNVVLVPGVNHVTIGVTVTGTDAALENVEFAEGGASHFLSGLTVVGVNAADRLRLSGCSYFAATAGSAQAVNLNAVEDGVVIDDCRVYGDFSAAAILSGSVLTDLTLTHNIVQNLAAGVHAIELTAAATGVAVRNYLIGTVLGTIFDPGSLRCLDNWETNAVDVFAIPTPYGAPAGASWTGVLGVDSITAATIAADAIGAAEIANGAIDLATFAANCLDNSKLADDLLSEEQFDADAAARMRLGVRVHRAAADIIDGTKKPLFTVAGRVLLTGLAMEISGAALDAGANLVRFISNPTVGADMNLCADLDTVAAAIGAIFGITGTITDAMTGAVAGGGAMMMARPILLPSGAIEINTGADKGTGGGLAAVTLWYVPFDTGATVVAI